MNDNNETVLKKCIAAIEEYNMLLPGTEVVVGVSGGADSVCLLSVLCRLREKYGVTVKAAHINHGIRGAEADRDSDFTKALCSKLGVEFHLLNADCIGEAAKTGESVEECGRRIRYAYFASLLVGENARIATAHNANDNAETVLFNLTRGTSLKGAAGIPPVRGNIIRPLIYCTRAEIEGYCADNDLAFVTDSTNLSDDYTRNRIRHKALPVLCEINGSAVNAFSRFSRSARADADYLDEKSNELLCSARLSPSSYSSEAISKAPESLKSRALYSAVYSFSGNKPDYQKLSELYAILENGGKIQLYDNCFAECAGSIFRLFGKRGESDTPHAVYLNSFEFNENFGKYNVSLAEYTLYSKKIHHLVLDNLIDCDTINGTLVLRGRESGDKITLSRRGVSKSLKKLFSEAGILPEERPLVPVLADDTGVVWVCGFGTTKRCLPGEESVNIYLAEGKKL